MKKLQKDPDTIAYAHNEEIVLIKRVVDDDGVHLTEVTLNPENGSKISERIVSDSEMKLTDFDTMKEFLTEATRRDFNADWSATKLNVDFVILEKTDLLSVQSVEDDYIERQDTAVEDCRTLDNAMNVLDSCLTKIQKKKIPFEPRERLIYPRNRRERWRFPAHGSGLSRTRREKNKNFSGKPRKIPLKTLKKTI